jgi:hypothetical protein
MEDSSCHDFLSALTLSFFLFLHLFHLPLFLLFLVFLNLLLLPLHIVTCIVVHATKMTGSNSDDWIY